MKGYNPRKTRETALTLTLGCNQKATGLKWLMDCNSWDGQDPQQIQRAAGLEWLMDCNSWEGTGAMIQEWSNGHDPQQIQRAAGFEWLRGNELRGLQSLKHSKSAILDWMRCCNPWESMDMQSLKDWGAVILKWARIRSHIVTLAVILEWLRD